MVDIRVLTEQDASAVYDMESAVFSDAYSQDTVGATVRASYALCLGAFQGDTLVGYLLGTVIDTEAELLRIAVSAAHRGAENGTLLLSAFLTNAERKGAKKVFLEVREDNHPAVCLYRKAGFRDLDRRKGYYRNPVSDALMMSYTFGETKHENIGF